MSDHPSPNRPSSEAYLGGRAPVGIIFGAFALVTVPLVLLEVIPNFVDWLPCAILFDAVGLGSTHFFITLALYLRTENLEYFRATRANKIVYFVVPAALFMLFALAAAGRLATRAPVAAMYIFGALRVLDFLHVGRQSFGVLQLFKRPLRVIWPRLRRAENVFFVGMGLLQFETFVLGGTFVPATRSVVPSALLGILFVVVVLSHLWARRIAAQPSLIPLGYFATQAVCASAAVYETRLYVAALAVHYVEYHVLMMPRCLQAPLSTRHSLGRAFGAITRCPVAFYGGLLAIVILFEARQHLAPSAPPTALFFAHIFDGVFVVHYFVEAFVWRFGNPFYRRTLEPLYFREASSPTLPHAPHVAMRSRGCAAATALACAFVLIGAAAARAQLDLVAQSIRRRLLDPIHAQNHLVWSIELAEEGQLVDARRHARKAVAYDASNRRAWAVLKAIDEHLPSSDEEP